jgi:hypothetical protein
MKCRDITIHDLVVTFTGNDIADPTSRTWYVSVVTRDNMDMSMEHGLPRCFTAVHANIEPVRLEFLLQDVLNVPHKVKSIGVFVVTHLPERQDVAPWNNEGMSGRNREAVKKSKRQSSLSKERAIYSAEDAIHS